MDQESIAQADDEKIGRFIYGVERHADPEQLRAAAFVQDSGWTHGENPLG